MNKKVIALIIGLLLILAGIIGWKCFQGTSQQEPAKVNEYVEEENTIQESSVTEETPVEENTAVSEEKEATAQPAKTVVLKKNKQNKTTVKTEKPVAETVAPKVEQKEETTVFEESVTETKTLEDVYVDGDSVVVNKEFKPGVKRHVFFRGVWYDIKTKLKGSAEK